MRLETEFFKADDGIDLFVRSYHPEQANPARTIHWIHGLGEHGGRQEHLAQLMTQRGWRLVIPDLRGHGRSGGAPTHVRSFDQYCDDIATVWQRLNLNSPSPVLVGHSMGGLVAVRTVQRGTVVPSALVLSSPLLGLKLRVNPIKELLGRIAVRFIPELRFPNGIDPSNMTRDSEFAAIRRGDTLINKTVTAGWFLAMKQSLKQARIEAQKVSLPVLALQGTNDQTTDPVALTDWCQRISSTDKELLVFPDHVHELFFEPDWSDTTNQVLDWLETRVGSKDRNKR